MDRDCYGNFDQNELHEATRDIERLLLKSGIVVIYCKHGLHRSVAGGRYVAEKLETEGYDVLMVNLGCASRWWAREYSVVRFAAGVGDS